MAHEARCKKENQLKQGKRTGGVSDCTRTSNGRETHDFRDDHARLPRPANEKTPPTENTMNRSITLHSPLPHCRRQLFASALRCESFACQCWTAFDLRSTAQTCALLLHLLTLRARTLELHTVHNREANALDVFPLRMPQKMASAMQSVMRTMNASEAAETRVVSCTELLTAEAALSDTAPC